MSFYGNFLTVSKPPAKKIREQMQEVVNQRFQVASTYWPDDIYKETEFGTLNFVPIEARINKLVESKLGDRVSDDYRKILFKDLSFKPKLGSRYKFDDNIWIVYSTDNIRTDTSGAYLRRCNNTLNTQDKYGNIHREPCYIDFKPTKTSFMEYDDLTVPYTKQMLFMQLNEWTKNLDIGDRYIFGESAYKISDRVKFNRLKTFEEDSLSFIRCYMDWDGLNEYDIIYDEQGNYIGIADYKEYNYTIHTQKQIIGKIGETDFLSATVYLDDEELKEEKVYWTSENKDIVSINKYTGEYTLLSIGKTNIFAVMENSEKIKAEVYVEVEEIPIEKYSNHIDPIVPYLTINQKQKYSVFETLNGKKTDAMFQIIPSNIPSKYYTLTIEGNDFYVTNKKQNENNLLRVTCINQRDNSEIFINIEFGGIF